MNDAGAWITPLLLLPGVGLLIMSTAARYAQLHGELHHVLDQGDEDVEYRVGRLLRRGRMFRNALMSLYASVFFLAMAGLLGGVADTIAEIPLWLVATNTIIAIGLITYTSAQLVHESVASMEALRRDAANHLARHEGG
ncbi:MAG: DUF2721 domain-containing protein [Myxococcota bacterium]